MGTAGNLIDSVDVSSQKTDAVDQGEQSKQAVSLRSPRAHEGGCWWRPHVAVLLLVEAGQTLFASAPGMATDKMSGVRCEWSPYGRGVWRRFCGSASVKSPRMAVCQMYSDYSRIGGEDPCPGLSSKLRLCERKCRILWALTECEDVHDANRSNKCEVVEDDEK